MTLWVWAAAGLAFLLGGVPFGFLVGRRLGVDVRQAGSGNIGATNVARVAGLKWGLLTLLFDALKGLVPTLVMLWVAPRLAPPEAQVNWIAGVGTAAFLGHCFSPYLGFRGGKGVATAFGVLLVLTPWAAGAAFLAYAAIYGFFHLSSLGSLVGAAVVISAAAWIYGTPEVWYVLAMVAVIVAKHRSNIVRLWTRSESRV